MGIVGKPGNIIIFNAMTKLLNKEKWGVIAQLCSLEVQTLKTYISLDLQKISVNHSKVFEAPKGLPPMHDHDHVIHLIPGSVLFLCSDLGNIDSYCYTTLLC